MNNPHSIWEARYASSKKKGSNHSSEWLDSWLQSADGQSRQALDLGCGFGIDTEGLLKAGFEVTSVDFAIEALKHSRARNPQATHIQRDLSEGIGHFEKSFSLVVANLSLHYFSKAQTERIVSGIHDALTEGGLFIFRVNSKEDKNFGAAVDSPDWALIDVGGVQKQFFNEPMIDELLENRFEIVSLEQLDTDRYTKTKKLIECVARKR
ncbi:class I SAM-dependent methyltransferase [Pelagicoccus mobilis]|uniref:Class I SAM-dependent methyltransferase n=1 Tax=Pelagicoccus mobilis TaxID=415221 RepID=A0A934S6D0_9BACT|nr:class I SAM-dependent methyltransferase [Pelagicoccus mobilis]MBK1880209.1 class I SAM-dependent methyltransferase [Pelagicoccus mobilis]